MIHGVGDFDWCVVVSSKWPRHFQTAQCNFRPLDTMSNSRSSNVNNSLRWAMTPDEKFKSLDSYRAFGGSAIRLHVSLNDLYRNGIMDSFFFPLISSCMWSISGSLLQISKSPIIRRKRLQQTLYKGAVNTEHLRKQLPLGLSLYESP